MLPFFNLFSSNPLKFLIFQAVEVAAGEVAFRLHPGPGHLPEGTETGSTEGEGCHQVSQPFSTFQRAQRQAAEKEKDVIRSVSQLVPTFQRGQRQAAQKENDVIRSVSQLVPSRGPRDRQHRKRRMSSGQSAY